MTDRVAVLSPVVARTPVCAPLLPARGVNALHATGIRRLGELQGWSFDRFLGSGVGVQSVSAVLDALHRLSALPADRLERLSWPAHPVPSTVPALPVDVITALCYAHSVAEEIAALGTDLEERKRRMLFMRWGVGCKPATLDEIGAAFGLTRERARQIIQAKEQQIAASGLRLPFASAAVEDLDEVGGALPTEDYAVLLRNSPYPVHSDHIRLLPMLHRLHCVPDIVLHEPSGLWLTSTGRARWVDDGEAVRLAAAARKKARYVMARIGVLPLQLVERMSPFGREHALWLAFGGRTMFATRGEYAVPHPLRECRLLRQCRKTLLVTGPLPLDELAHALRRDRNAHISAELLRCVLAATAAFSVRDDRASLAKPLRPHDILSPAERAAWELFDANGGAMLWLDFQDAFVARGFSAAMAAVIVRKPAIRQLGPALYGLRGRAIAPEHLQRLRRRRAELLAGGGPIVAVRENGAELTVDYQLNRFTMQGVLPAPPQLRHAPRSWQATFSGGGNARIRIANHFIWPVRWWLEERKLAPGDHVRVTFRTEELRAEFADDGRAAAVTRTRHRSREEQVIRALFGHHI